MHALFTAPAAQVDFSMVKDFVSLRIPEGLTIEYKREGDKPLDAIAAFANTYGGLLLYGVSEEKSNKGVPEEVVGVSRKEKDILINRMVNSFDPPFWSPEIIEIETGLNDKVMLVIRVNADEAPRPIIFEGSILFRADGRSVKAPRQLMRTLLNEEPAGSLANGFTMAMHGPHNRPSVFKQDSNDPDVVVRAFACQSLWPGHPRARFSSGIDLTLRDALNTSPFMKAVHQVAKEMDRPQVTSWEVDRAYVSSQSLKLRCRGEAVGVSRTPSGFRAECLVQIDGHGPFTLEACLDIWLWLGTGMKLGIPILEHVLMREIQGLITHVFPCAMKAVTGGLYLPVPPVEVHVAARQDRILNPGMEPSSLERFLDLGSLGDQVSDRTHTQGCVVLLQDLVEASDWSSAVKDAMTTMAMDWGFPSPNFEWVTS